MLEGKLMAGKIAGQHVGPRKQGTEAPCDLACLNEAGNSWKLLVRHMVMPNRCLETPHTFPLPT